MAARSVGRGATANDTRRATKDWDPWLVPCTPNDNSPYPRKCVFCGWSKVFVRKRAFSHFGYGGSSSSDRCKKMPATVQEKFKNCGGTVPKAMSYEEVYESIPAPHAVHEVVGASIVDLDVEESINPPSRNESGTPAPDSMDSVTIAVGRQRNTPLVSRQRSMDEALDVGLRQKLDRLWASFFYEANIAFNVVRHPAFIKAVKETASAGIVYQPPSYNAVRTKMIDVKKLAVSKMVSERTKNSIAHYGMTIYLDDWSNTTMRPLMNLMLVCPAGDVFLGSVDSTGQRKDIAYTTNLMAEVIEEVGPQNVVQLCTDNAAVMTGAMMKLKEQYPHLYTQGCAAHILDLLLEDWGKIKLVKDLIADAKGIVKFVKKYHVTLALFRKWSPKRALRLSSETRFAFQFLMIERLVDCKQALHNVVLDETYMPFEMSLEHRKNGTMLRFKAKNARLDICSDSFWVRCENFLHMVEPVLIALRHFDGKIPAMPKAWVIMKGLEQHVYSLREAPFFLDPVVASRFEKQFDERWKLMRTDLHYVGALLNPFLNDVGAITEDGEANRALNRVLRKLSEPLGVSYAEAMNEMIQFEEKTGPFDPSEAPDIHECNLLPHQWWSRVGGKALPKIAKRILSLTCSASSCERNWSMYSFVHNKVRNRLDTAKAKDLVYIYANSKLERSKRGYNAALFYDQAIVDANTEDENEEATFSSSDDDVVGSQARVDENNMEEEERLLGSPWEAMMAASTERFGRRRYGNTFTSVDVVGASVPRVVQEVYEAEENHISAPNIDAVQATESSPIMVESLDGNNDGAPIVPSMEQEKARSPVAPRRSSRIQMALRIVEQCGSGNVEEEEEAQIHDVVQEGHLGTTTRMESIEYDSDLPLNRIMPLNRNASPIQGGTRSLPSVRRSDPTPSRRLRLHQSVLPTVNEEVQASAPQPTQPSSISGVGEPSSRVCQPNKKGSKRRRIKRMDERVHRNPKRANRVVQKCILGGGSSTQNIRESGTGAKHPPNNIDGTTDTLRLTKRLVQTEEINGIDTQVRNLNSEIEREVQHDLMAKEDDENRSSGDDSQSDESDEDTDPNADEVPSDDTFAPGD